MVITANLAPVCGSDGQTYPNPSALESMSCLANRIVEAEYSGECRGELEQLMIDDWKSEWEALEVTNNCEA